MALEDITRSLPTKKVLSRRWDLNQSNTQPFKPTTFSSRDKRMLWWTGSEAAGRSSNKLDVKSNFACLAALISIVICNWSSSQRFSAWQRVRVSSSHQKWELGLDRKIFRGATELRQDSHNELKSVIKSSGHPNNEPPAKLKAETKLVSPRVNRERQEEAAAVCFGKKAALKYTGKWSDKCWLTSILRNKIKSKWCLSHVLHH